jgi:hypothetical protein
MNRLLTKTDVRSTLKRISSQYHQKLKTASDLSSARRFCEGILSLLSCSYRHLSQLIFPTWYSISGYSIQSHKGPLNSDRLFHPFFVLTHSGPRFIMNLVYKSIMEQVLSFALPAGSLGREEWLEHA